MRFLCQHYRRNADPCIVQCTTCALMERTRYEVITNDAGTVIITTDRERIVGKWALAHDPHTTPQ